MSDRPSAFGATATARRVRFMKERMLHANEEIVKRSFKLKSPKDIEELYAYETDFFAIVCEKVDNANVLEQKIYKKLGFNFEQVQFMKQDQAIAKSWIDWYKHQREQHLAEIKAIESQFPPRPEYQIKSIKHPNFGEWAVTGNFDIPRPEFAYRLRQAEEYCRVLYNIFCAPNPAPAPGNPLPADLPVPDFSAPAPRRFPCRNYVFAESLTYSQGCARLISFFLTSAIREGKTSDLLPLVIPSA